MELVLTRILRTRDSRVCREETLRLLDGHKLLMRHDADVMMHQTVTESAPALYLVAIRIRQYCGQIAKTTPNCRLHPCLAVT